MFEETFQETPDIQKKPGVEENISAVEPDKSELDFLSEIIETTRALKGAKSIDDQEEVYYDDEDLQPHHYGSFGEVIID